MAKAFREADTNIYQSSWDIWKESSADRALDYGQSLQLLREKSQQLIRDNPIVAGFQQTYINLICGAGPAIYCQTNNRIQQEQADKVLSDWFVSCDSTGTKSFNNIIEEIIAASFADGDILINLPIDSKRDTSGVQTVVELIEAYRIKTPSDKTNNDNIRHGVQYDSFGRIEGFWVKNYDKLAARVSDNSENFKFFPRIIGGREVTRLFKAPSGVRPSSSRQYPLITPAISKLKHIDDYYEAVIIGARVSACFAAFIITKNPGATMTAMTTDGNTGDPLKDTNTAKPYSKLQPGMIGYLRPGEEAQFAAPNKPGDNVDDFVVRSCKLMSMTLRLPYIVAFLDTKEVTYSAWRGALLDTRKMTTRWNRELNSIIDWIGKTVLYEAILNEQIRGSLNTIHIKKRWPTIGVLDMEKEARGNKIALESKVTSRQYVCDETGIDTDELEKELLEEALADVDREAEVLVRKKELEKDKGIIFPENKEDATPKDSGQVDEETATERRKEDGNWQSPIKSAQ